MSTPRCSGSLGLHKHEHAGNALRVNSNALVRQDLPSALADEGICPFPRVAKRGSELRSFRFRRCLTFVSLFFIFFLMVALPPLGVQMAAARVVPPVPSGPFACYGATHEDHVSKDVPDFLSSSLTVSADRCTYGKGLQITLPTSAPPPGTQPLVRILIYQSSFLSPNSDRPALLIRSANGAASQHYRLEVVIANSTLRAERTSGAGDTVALHFYASFTNATITVFGCYISATSSAAFSSIAIALTESSVRNSTIRLLSSTVEGYGGAGLGCAVLFLDSVVVDTRLNISGSLLSASGRKVSQAIKFETSSLLRSTVLLFGVRMATTATGVDARCLYFHASNLTGTMVHVYGGSIEATTSAQGSPQAVIFGFSHLSNSIVSFHGTAITATATGDIIAADCLHLFGCTVSACTVEVIGGSMAVTHRGSGDAAIVALTKTFVAGGSIIRTNGTVNTCESSKLGCTVFFLPSCSVRDSLIGFYGGSLVLNGKSASILWVVQESETMISNTTLVASRCDAWLSLGPASTRDILTQHLSGLIGAGVLFYWHHSTYSIGGGPKTQLSPTYTCGFTACPTLSVRINDDAATPLVPAVCPHCLFPYGAPVRFDDGSDNDYRIFYDRLFTNSFSTVSSEALTALGTLTITGARTSSEQSLASASREESQSCSANQTNTESAKHASTSSNAPATQTPVGTKSRSRGRRRPPRGGPQVAFVDHPIKFRSNSPRPGP